MNELQKIIDIIQNIIVKSFAIDEDKLINFEQKRLTPYRS